MGGQVAGLSEGDHAILGQVKGSLDALSEVLTRFFAWKDEMLQSSLIDPKSMISLVLITSQLYLTHNEMARRVQGLVDVVEKGIERSANQEIWYAGDDAVSEADEGERSALLGWCRLAARLRMRLAGQSHVQSMARLSRQVALLEAERVDLLEQLAARKAAQAEGGEAGNEGVPTSDVAELLEEMNRVQARIAAEVRMPPTAESLRKIGYKPAGAGPPKKTKKASRKGGAAVPQQTSSQDLAEAPSSLFGGTNESIAEAEASLADLASPSVSGTGRWTPTQDSSSYLGNTARRSEAPSDARAKRKGHKSARARKGQGSRPAEDSTVAGEDSMGSIQQVDALLKSMHMRLKEGSYMHDALEREGSGASTSTRRRKSHGGGLRLGGEGGVGESLGAALGDAAKKNTRFLEDYHGAQAARFDSEDLAAPQFTMVRIAHVDPATMAHAESRIQQRAAKARGDSHTAAALDTLFVRDAQSVPPARAASLRPPDAASTGAVERLIVGEMEGLTRTETIPESEAGVGWKQAPGHEGSKSTAVSRWNSVAVVSGPED